MSKDLIVKANALIEASYHLTANEQRLILSAIAQIGDKPVTDDEVYYVSAKDMEALGLNKTTAYRELYEAGERLFSRTVTLRVSSSILKTRWVQDLYKFDGKLLRETADMPFMDLNASIGVRFSKSVLPFLNSLTSNFTKYKLNEIAGFSSHYSYRFYEFMMQFKSTGYMKINIRDLRERLELGNKYPATKDLKVRVIDTAINEINAKSPYKVEYKLFKTGRKFTHLELKFKKKEKEIIKMNNESRDPDTLNIFHKLTDKELNIVRLKVTEYITHLENKGEVVSDFHRKNITNKAIAEKWGIAEYQQQQAQEQAEKERHAQELAKQQAEAKRQQQKVQKQEAENRAFVEHFENLPQDEQNHIIGEVGNAIAPLFKEYFDEAVANGTAHKDLMYRGFFRQAMGNG